ncbi:hypothetical protein Tco_0272571 [Tanacetum coccineum]
MAMRGNMTLIRIASMAVKLCKSNQTIYDAPDGFVGLYTHSFSLVNLKLPLLKFFCDVLEYLRVHVSMLNPFGCAKLTTFAVMCKAYDGEPTLELFRGFFNLYHGVQWLTFAKGQRKISPIEYLELLSKDNRWDKRSFKDKTPPSIYENPLYRCLGRHPVNVRTFSDPILFLASLKPSWAIVNSGLRFIDSFSSFIEMAFGDFMFAKNDEETSFLPRELSPGFGAGSPSALINNEPPFLEAEILDSANLDQLVENTVYFEGSPARGEMLAIGIGSVKRRMKDRKCMTKGSTKPPVKPRELVKVMEHMKGECEVLKERETTMDKECKGLKAKYEAISIIILPLMFFENLVTLELKVVALEVEKGKSEVVEATFRREIKAVKCDRVEVVSKVVAYVAMELVHIDKMAMLVGKLVSSVIFYRRCVAFEEVANMKESFDLAKVKGYRPSYKKEYTKAGNDLANAIFPFLSEVKEDHFASVEILLSKKQKSIRNPTPTKTHAPASSAPSQKATPSSATPKPMYPPSAV